MAHAALTAFFLVSACVAASVEQQDDAAQKTNKKEQTQLPSQPQHPQRSPESSGHYPVKIPRTPSESHPDSVHMIEAAPQSTAPVSQPTAHPSGKHRTPSWARQVQDNEDGMGVGFDPSKLRHAPKGGSRPMAGSSAHPVNEVNVANPSVGKAMFNPAQRAQAITGSQDPDLDGPSAGPALNKDGETVQGMQQPANMFDRIDKIGGKWAEATKTMNQQWAATLDSVQQLAKNSGTAYDSPDKMASQAGVSFAAAGPEQRQRIPGQTSMIAAGDVGGDDGALQKEDLQDKTSMTNDMATAAVMAGLRGASRHPHRDKVLVGSTLRRAQKSLAGNGFDHTNGQYGVPTAQGQSGLGNGQLGIYKPDYGPFGMGPTSGAMFNLGTQPQGSKFQNPMQQGLEANREAVNDLASMPAATSGMMGGAGIGMMGNYMAYNPGFGNM